jgi:hypothetical protein
MIARPGREINSLRRNPAQSAPFPGGTFLGNTRNSLEKQKENWYARLDLNQRSLLRSRVPRES